MDGEGAAAGAAELLGADTVERDGDADAPDIGEGNRILEIRAICHGLLNRIWFEIHIVLEGMAQAEAFPSP